MEPDGDPTVTSGHPGHLLEMRNSLRAVDAAGGGRAAFDLPVNVCSRTVEILHGSLEPARPHRATVSSESDGCTESASDTHSGGSNGGGEPPAAPGAPLAAARRPAPYGDAAPLTLVAREYCLDSPADDDQLPPPPADAYGAMEGDDEEDEADPSSVVVRRCPATTQTHGAQSAVAPAGDTSSSYDCRTSVDMTGSLLRQSVPGGGGAAANRPISYTNDGRLSGRSPSPRLDGRSIEVLNERMDTLVLAAGGGDERRTVAVPYSDQPTVPMGQDCDSEEGNEGSDDGVTPLATDKFGFFADGPARAQAANDQTMSTDGANTLSRSMRAAASVPVETLRRREQKWLHMLDHWPQFMDKQYLRLRRRCRKGIPSALRGRAWKYLCGAHYHMTSAASKHVFDLLDSHPGDAGTNEEIRKDISRQFPDHELFSRRGPYKHGAIGQEELYRLLKAYTILQPEEGYCQGQAPVAAALLMHMPLKDAFYCFVQLCHKYLNGYYSTGLEAIQIDGRILGKLLKSKCRPAYKHLKKQGIDGSLYMVEWFMCLYCRTLPWPTVLRIWDMFFCEGIKVIFKVAVVLFRLVLGSKEQLRHCPDLYTTLDQLKNLPADVTKEELLVPKVIELQIDEEDLERLHYAEWKRWNKEQARKNKR